MHLSQKVTVLLETALYVIFSSMITSRWGETRYFNKLCQTLFNPRSLGSVQAKYLCKSNKELG